MHVPVVQTSCRTGDDGRLEVVTKFAAGNGAGPNVTIIRKNAIMRKNAAHMCTGSQTCRQILFVLRSFSEVRHWGDY